MRTLPVRWREALVAGIVLAAAGLLTVASQLAEPGSYTVANDLVFFLVLLGCPTLVAAGWVNRTRQVRELKRLAAIRTRQLQAETQAARIREATRIGEEVQRSIGQTLSAILVRAEGAGGAASANNSLEQVEAAARTALAEIEAAARSALQQLREHIGVLREPIGVVGRSGR